MPLARSKRSKNAGKLDKVKIVALDGTVDAVTAVANGQLLTTVGGGYACGAFALVELYDSINGHAPDQQIVNIPLLPITKDNVKAYQDQVLNGMNSYALQVRVVDLHAGCEHFSVQDHPALSRVHHRCRKVGPCHREVKRRSN